VSEKRSYVGSGMPLTESAIDWGLTRDIYVALSAPVDEATNAWSLRVQHKPFVRWIWLGVLGMALGALSAALARRRGRPSAQAAPAVS